MIAGNDMKEIVEKKLAGCHWQTVDSERC